jgi:hypothetical protein
MNNPKLALDSILDNEQNISDKITVYPITMGRYALLELVNSPFINSSREFSVSNLLPTFYIMTNDYKKLTGYNSKNIEKIEEAAMIWAEDFDVDLTGKLIDEIAERLGLLKKVSPDTGDDTDNDGKKK